MMKICTEKKSESEKKKDEDEGGTKAIKVSDFSIYCTTQHLTFFFLSIESSLYYIHTQSLPENQSLQETVTVTQQQHSTALRSQKKEKGKAKIIQLFCLEPLKQAPTKRAGRAQHIREQEWKNEKNVSLGQLKRWSADKTDQAAAVVVLQIIIELKSTKQHITITKVEYLTHFLTLIAAVLISYLLFVRMEKFNFVQLILNMQKQAWQSLILLHQIFILETVIIVKLMALSLLVYACCFLTFSSSSCSPEIISRLTFTCPCSCFSFVVSRQGWSALVKAIYWYFEFVSLHNIKASHSYWCETERIKNWMGQRVESWMWLSGKGLSGSGILLVFFDISERWVSCLFWCFAAASTSSFLFFLSSSQWMWSPQFPCTNEREIGKETRKKAEGGGVKALNFSWRQRTTLGEMNDYDNTFWEWHQREHNTKTNGEDTATNDSRDFSKSDKRNGVLDTAAQKTTTTWQHSFRHNIIKCKVKLFKKKQIA